MVGDLTLPGRLVALLKQQPSPRTLRRFVLFLQYEQRQALPQMLQVITLLLAAAPIGISLSFLTPLIRLLVLQADFFLSLGILAQLGDVLKMGEDAQVLIHLEGEWGLFLGSESEYSSPSLVEEGKAVRVQLLLLMEWLNERNYLHFLLGLLDCQDPHQHIQSFFLEIATVPASPFSSEEIDEWKRNLTAESSKSCKKIGRQSLAGESLRWICGHVASVAKGNGGARALALPVLQTVVRSGSTLVCTALLRALEGRLKDFSGSRSQILLGLIDCCMLEGSQRTALQTALFLVPALFSSLRTGGIKMGSNLVCNHFQLWRQAGERRNLGLKVLNVLCSWLKGLMGGEGADQGLQLGRAQLLSCEFLPQDSQLSQLICLLGDLQKRKLAQLESEMQPMQSFVSSGQSSPRSYLASKLSHLALSSMVDSFGSSLSSQSINQLQLVSKKLSMPADSVLSEGGPEQVEIVLSLAELFAYRPKPTISNPSSSEISKQSTPPLTKQSILPQEWKPMFRALSQEEKRLVVKNRGVVVRENSLQVGMTVESRAGRRQISLYFTSAQKLSKLIAKIRGNSVRFETSFYLEIKNPPTNKQIRYQLLIEQASLKGEPGRWVGPVLQLEWIDSQRNSMEVPLPLRPVQLLQWLPIEKEGQQDVALLSSPWLPKCQRFRKSSQEYFSRLFPMHHLDKRGNALLRCRWLGKARKLRILIVMGQVRVQLLDCQQGIIIAAILELLAEPQ